MLGIMQDWPLTVNRVIEHANRIHSDREIVTRRVEGDIVRTSYGDIFKLSKQVSNALKSDGIQLGDRVATLGWNSARHMASWYGAMGIGAVLHTLNPRLHPEQIAWIANHAEDKVLIFDKTFLPLVEAIKDHLPMVKRFVIYSLPSAFGGIFRKKQPADFVIRLVRRATRRAFYILIDRTFFTH